MTCTDRQGHDLQVGDTVAVVGETSADNRWYICQIVDQGESQAVHILRLRPYRIVDRGQDVHIERHNLDAPCHIEWRVFSNNDLVFIERLANDDLRRWLSVLSRSSAHDRAAAWGKIIPAFTNLILGVQNSDTRFEFDADQVEELVIGRKDPQTGISPHVDLVNAGALEKGVSRNHASIICKDGALQIMDNGSVNRTYLNGQRLVAHQPCVIRDGHEVRLAKLVLHIRFQRDLTPPPNPLPTS